MTRWIVCCLWILVGCGGAAVSETSAHVSRSTAERGFEAAERAIPYLPMRYTADGCYARAFYMAMEVAAEAIPVSVQYAYMVGGALEPDAETHWEYHVTPMLWIDNDAEPLVLDPVFFARPVERSTWVDRLHAVGGVAQLGFAQGSNLAFVSGALADGPFAANELIDTFAAMAPFSAGDVSYACSIMSSYIANEPGLSRAEKWAKDDALKARTKVLAASLRALGKGPSGQLSNASDSCY